MKNAMIGCVVVVAALLAGCSLGTSVEEQLSDAIAELNRAESEYKEVQAELFDLEQEEQQLFNETMELTKGQHNELATKVVELEELLTQRLVQLEKEQSSIQNAKAAVSNFDSVIEKADVEDKMTIEELKTVVNNRYELHAVFISEYKELAALQKKLYEMLLAEETELKELKKQVNKVNAQNKVVQATITSFNKVTADANVLKDEVMFSLQEHN